MSVHTHTMRNWFAEALVLLPVLLLLSWAWAPPSKDLALARVSGQVTCADRPISGSIYFLPDDERRPVAVGIVNPDGSFQLYLNGRRDRRGALPGTYRVVVRPRVSDKTAPRVDSKYQDAHTTNLLVHVKPDWNHVRLTLQ